MSVELERWRCPRCGSVEDVWLQDGKPEVEQVTIETATDTRVVNAKTTCSQCYADGWLVSLALDPVETAALGS